MTSKEINALLPMDSYATESHLLAAIATMIQEIAYQLAVRNEREAPLTWEQAFDLSDQAMTAIYGREKNHA